MILRISGRVEGLVLGLVLGMGILSPAFAQSPFPGEPTRDRCIAVTALIGTSLMNSEDPSQQTQGYGMLERSIALLPDDAIDPATPDRNAAVRAAVMARVNGMLETMTPGEFDYQGAVALWRLCNDTFPSANPAVTRSN
jgi:hypothetical protein